MLVSRIKEDDLTVQMVDQLLFQGLEDSGESADCIIVLGSIKAAKYRVPVAAQAYKAGRASKLMFCGGKLRDFPDGKYSEAEHMRQAALALGVAEEDIILENRSQNTVENILFALVELQRTFWLNKVRRVLLVTTAYHMRRSLAIARYLFPEYIAIIPCPANDNNTRRDNWMNTPVGIARAKSEAMKIVSYVMSGINVPDLPARAKLRINMKNMSKKRFLLIASAIVLICLAIWAFWGNTALEINEYAIVSDRIPDAFAGFRIAQVSDFHNAEFGEDNSKLIELLSQTDPDIIVLTGDLIDSRRTDIEIALAFAEQAVTIAPVYYVSGNHEARVPEYADLKKGLVDAGVTVLENLKVEITRAGERITLMGIDDPSFLEDYLFGDAEAVARQAIDDLQNESDGYTVLLSHRPELFDVYVDTGIDLVFSGHAHGGQFRLPFVGGLVAPNQGFFPEYDAGQFTEKNTTMLVSRGVGNSIVPIRINNRPEIVVAQLEA